MTTAPKSPHIGEWLRQLREKAELPLRAVAEACGMDLALLHKCELGQRIPTEEQTSRLAKFFKVPVADAMALRIAEKMRHDYSDHPAMKQAVQMLAEEHGIYKTR
jgi:HTH-type transcriptional regulator, competence development regulator